MSHDLPALAAKLRRLADQVEQGHASDTILFSLDRWFELAETHGYYDEGEQHHGADG